MSLIDQVIQNVSTRSPLLEAKEALREQFKKEIKNLQEKIDSFLPEKVIEKYLNAYMENKQACLNNRMHYVGNMLYSSDNPKNELEKLKILYKEIFGEEYKD